MGTSLARRAGGGRRPLAVVLIAGALLAGATLPILSSPGVASASTGGPPPAVPSYGAYLGLWLNPAKVTSVTTPPNLLSVIHQLPGFEASIGRPLGFEHLYQNGRLNPPVSNGTLRAVAATGAIPMIDWPCEPTEDVNVITGTKALLAKIEGFAKQLAAYGGPVFLRWAWEMNFNNTPNKKCEGTTLSRRPTNYVAAWQDIRNIFAGNATNVAFVWCPSASTGAATPKAFYPGTSYVDWIGMDAYDRPKNSPTTVFTQWQTFYTKFSGFGKPMMVDETGSTNTTNLPNRQVSFLETAEKVIPTMPQIKGWAYYDSEKKGTTIVNGGNWTLTAKSLTQFIALGNDPYFSFLSP